MAVTADKYSKEFRELCDQYYTEDLADIFADFKDRFIGKSTDGTLATTFAQDAFNYENELKKGLNQRINKIPTSIIVASEDKTSDELQLHWQQYFNEHIGLTRGIAKDMEVYGASFYWLPDKDKQWKRLSNIDYYPVSEDNEVIGYRFEYYDTRYDEEGNSRVDKTTLVITKEEVTYQLNGTTIDVFDSNLSQIPLVAFIREDNGAGIGLPGTTDLINGQRNINAAVTKRAEATKIDSFGIWCPDGSEFSGIDMTDKFIIRPGSYIPFPIKKVGSGADLSSIEKEIQDARNDVRSAALFLNLTDTEDSRQAGASGRAQLVANRGFNDYCNGLKQQIAAGLNQMLSVASEATDVSAEGIKITLPALEKEDPLFVLQAAESLRDSGYQEEYLVKQGYDEEDIKRLEAQRLKEEGREDVSTSNFLTDADERG
jgi:hypothetical protein